MTETNTVYRPPIEQLKKQIETWTLMPDKIENSTLYSVLEYVEYLEKQLLQQMQHGCWDDYPDVRELYENM